MADKHGFKSMLPAGTVLRSSYTITGYFASGGFGNTYKATNAFDETVAIKEFFMRDVMTRSDNSTLAQVADSSDTEIVKEQRQKFKKEALRLRHFNNSHIVKVYDYFEENNTAYYVMDFIDGETLSERQAHQGRAFSEEEVKAILPSILDALDDIHKAGFFHLDIKPSNIMIDKDNHVFLIDFGASKQIKANESGATTGTQVSFTPDYAPSEILESRMDKVGPWTDLYSLGATLYKLLTGEKPPRQTDIVESGASAFRFSSSISASMKKAIIKMMSIRRADRPQNVNELRGLLNLNPTTEDKVEVLDNTGNDAISGNNQDVSIVNASTQITPMPDEDVNDVRYEPVYDETPEITGWLKFFLYVIGFNCLAVLGILLKDLASDEYKGMEMLQVADVLQCGFIICLGCVAINAFVKQKSNAVFYGRAFLVICALDNIIYVFMNPDASDAGRCVGALIWCVIWLGFLHYSTLVQEIYPIEKRRVNTKDWIMASASFLVPWTIILIWFLNIVQTNNSSNSDYSVNHDTSVEDSQDKSTSKDIDPKTLAHGELTDGNVAFIIPSQYITEKQYTDSLQTHWLYTFNNGKKQSVYGLVVSDYYSGWNKQQFSQVWKGWWDDNLKGLTSKVLYEGDYIINGNQCYERRIIYQGNVQIIFDLTAVYNEQRQWLCLVRTEYVEGQKNPMQDIVKSIRFE